MKRRILTSVSILVQATAASPPNFISFHFAESQRNPIRSIFDRPKPVCVYFVVQKLLIRHESFATPNSWMNWRFVNFNYAYWILLAILVFESINNSPDPIVNRTTIWWPLTTSRDHEAPIFQIHATLRPNQSFFIFANPSFRDSRMIQMILLISPEDCYAANGYDNRIRWPRIEPRADSKVCEIVAKCQSIMPDLCVLGGPNRVVSVPL